MRNDQVNPIFAHSITKCKHCPRCGGRLFHDKDENGEYDECLNCGHTIDTVRPCDNCGKPTSHKSYQYVGGTGNKEFADCGCGAE